jgi:hypothetical protein
MSRRVSVSKKGNVLSRGASGATLSSSIVRPRPTPSTPFPPASTQLFVSLTTGEAMEYGITEAELMEAAGGDLKAYMLAELNRAVDHAVEDRG